MRTYVAVVAALILALAGVIFGAWWAPFLIAAALGLIVPTARMAVPLGALIGFGAWMLPLASEHVRYGLGPSAGALSAIMGFGHQGAVPVILTLLVGTLLGLSGAWLGSGARALYSHTLRPRVDAARGE